jgi:hypothetical protein
MRIHVRAAAALVVFFAVGMSLLDGWTLLQNTVMQNNHIRCRSSAALSYTNTRADTTPSLLTFIGTTTPQH